ncbi:MAG: hypothetical protein AAFW75_00495 [Cyanobacteria bacterium J06636_16]
MIEGRTGPFVEAALAGAAEMEGIAKARHLVEANASVFGLAMRALHEGGGVVTAS